jgi:hypothetical protein
MIPPTDLDEQLITTSPKVDQYVGVSTTRSVTQIDEVSRSPSNGARSPLSSRTGA